MSKLAIITAHYNWANFDMPVRNLRRFLRQMERYKVPVYGVELYLRDQEPEMAGQPGWKSIPVKESAILWQKEALLNMAERMVPDDFDIVAPIDADVEFANPNWHSDTLRAMQFHPVVQIFSDALWTDRRGKVCRQRASVCRLGLDMDRWTTHPGFAWAFRRDLYREMGGWYDIAPMGAGDTLLCVALQKQRLPKKWMDHAYSYLGPKNRAHFDAWMERVRDAMRGQSVGYVPGQVIHEWHGDLVNRRYHERARWIEGYDAKRHIRKNRAGYLQWTWFAPAKLKNDMIAYFAQRDEDGTSTPDK